MAAPLGGRVLGGRVLGGRVLGGRVLGGRVLGGRVLRGRVQRDPLPTRHRAGVAVPGHNQAINRVRQGIATRSSTSVVR
ncbi:hypothetical protein Ade02nite_12070 [Paractinoplanes deccanensis]|uniref:Uncharacterized protein n=1 Tax=Paractinoplanes deccanensis TaxID=113561 RepID=A0ABQ3XXV1_9ACTN|nr:hypothetical protein Ade02nite_12070 [Actinoplanes deccanensis]